MENEEFNILVCEALFLSLYNNGKLTKSQYEECIRKI